MTQYYIDVSDLSSLPKIETFFGSRVDKFKTQLGICRSNVHVLVIVKISLGFKISKSWCFYVKLYDNE